MSIRWGTPVARGVLATTIMASGMAMLDGTVVNVALPRIGKELEASVAGLQWILDGYLLSLASLILIAGSLGDRYGRRKVYILGIVWFGLASLLCGIAPTTELLVAARILQGIGGALLTPGSLAILQSSFDRADRARAIGAWSGLGGIAAAVGPLVGGLLVQAWSWRLAFLINLPVAVVCVWMARKYVPESRDEQMQGHPDIVSSALGAVGLAGLTAALVEAPVRGADPIVLVAGILGVAGLTAFVVLQIKSHDPLVPPEMFRDRTFTLSNGLTFVVYTALGGVMMLLVLQLQVSLGYGPTAAGVAGLPITVIMLLTSSLSGRLAQRIGPRLQLVIGPLVIAVGMLLMMRIGPGASYVTEVLPAVVVFGLGLTTVVAPVTATVLAAAEDRHAGVASGVNNAIARTGGLLAVAVLPAVAGLNGAAYTDPAALTDAWRTSLTICAVLAAVGGLLALGVRNDVLGGTPEPEHEAPAPGECLHCGVEGPPTHIKPSGSPEASVD
ncbi:MFS transporter [Kibdelosporangium phytohabitans]|uniref:MFS transporter n=1 Tax=Kibdelosporangium phytohabitans TaxID=860235 RepID=A0A0N9HNP5_9PSEU|nr:MFS transporter [Kibdelosporangium phytohabitans]ALG05953.1 MFS transporter [Kibdelosporangium phytohabitans]MBE1465993.1 EmrB/QacA subfamily drug resistance transporter [Kibdelosporangium phytohabitans]